MRRRIFRNLQPKLQFREGPCKRIHSCQEFTFTTLRYAQIESGFTFAIAVLNVLAF
jgi:hypothetical protein